MIFAIVFYCLVVVPPILLLWEWIGRFAERRYPISLVLTTISCLWILLGLLWRGAIGPDYSNLHAYIALVNLGVNLLVAIASVALRSQRSFRTAIAALSLALVWAFIFEIMYAV